MTGVAVGAEREQIIRWMEEGRNILEIIVKLLNDADQLKMAADATQKENERLRYECDQLRREVNELHADHERSKKERAEIAQWFSSVMSEAASRLLIERHRRRHGHIQGRLRIRARLVRRPRGRMASGTARRVRALRASCRAPHPADHTDNRSASRHEPRG